MRPAFCLSLAACLPLLAACAEGGSGPCRVTQVATFTLLRDHSLILAPATIEGSPVQMLIDTGAEATVISGDIMSRLNLIADPRHGTLMSGVGGQGIAQNDALVGHLQFGGYDPGLGHYAVVHLPVALGEGGAFGGILGGDVLSHFDLDLDVRNRKLTLYDVHHCSGLFLPWKQPYTSVPIQTTWGSGRLLVPATVDGVKLDAMLDTGASASMLDQPAAERLGVTEEAFAKEPKAPGFGAAGVNFNRIEHRFRELRIGSDVFPNPSLLVLDRSLHEADMLLGEDYLQLRHVWVSYRTHQLFIASRP